MLNKEHPNIAAMRAGKAALDDMLRRGTATDAEIDTAKKGLEETERYVQQKAVAGNRNIIAKLNALGGPYDNNYDNEDDWDGDRDNIASEKAAIARSFMRKQPYQARISRKAISAGALNLTHTAVGPFGAPVGAAATSLRDLFPTQVVDTPTIRYYKIGPVTGGPDIVAEGALKPEMVPILAAKDESMVKLAGRFVATYEFLDDAPELAKEVLKQALFQLLARENKLVLDRMNDASGIVAASGTKATALETIATQVGVQESVNGLTPECIVINPADLAVMRMTKASGSGEFLLGDPLSAGQSSGIFGIPVISTPSLTAGTVWLVRREAGIFYERQSCTIMTAPSGDDFDHNRVTTVIEERVLPVIVQPSLLTRITLTA